MDVTQENISARYRIIDQLGVGSMGTVYHVYDRLNANDIALKLVNATALHLGLLDTSLDYRLALAHEFQILAGMRHPHIISVLDYGFDKQGLPYFTMDLLSDRQTILEAGAGASIPRKVRLVVQMLQALVYLHRRGILHRDLKPANALVSNQRLRLLDFGLALEYARWQNDDIVSGTPAYIAPELLSGGAPSTASDLYAVGVILYELLTSRHPFDTGSLSKLIFNVMNTAPNLGALVTQLNIARQTHEYPVAVVEGDDLILKIVRKLLEKQPEARYQDAAEVIRDLSQAVGEPLPVETSETRESFLQASRFVGREDELTRLNEALSSAIAKRGSLWFVHGESGVGKSRLMSEFRAKAMVKGALVVRSQANDQGLSYQIWREPLRRLVLEVEIDEADAATLRTIVPDIDRLLDKPIQSIAGDDQEEAQERLHQTIISILRRLQQPLVILMDDLHLVSSESHAILDRITQSLEESSVLIIGSYRDDEVERGLNDLYPSANRIRLKRFTPEDIARLSEAMLGSQGQSVVDFIQRETEGNAFFLIEIMRALAEELGQLERIGIVPDLPQNVLTIRLQHLVQRRLNRVPRKDYPLLQVAAALGRQIDLKVLQAFSPETNLQDWLMVCSNAAVLEWQENAWQFTHNKMREGVNITLNQQQMAEIHRQAALALEAVYEDDSKYAGALMNHWRNAQDFMKECHYALIAGSHAYFVGANQEALKYYERALLLLEDEHTPQYLAINNKLAAVLIRLGMLDEALMLLYKTLEQVEKSHKSDPNLLGTILSSLGSAYLSKGAYDDAANAFTSSLSIFMNLGDQMEAAYTLIHLGHVHANQGDYKKAESYFEDSLNVLRLTRAQWGIGQALNALGRIKAARGDFIQAERIFNEALSIHRDLNNRDGIVSVSFNLGTLAAFQGQFDEAERRLNQSLAIAREINAQWNIAAALSNLGMIALQQQRFQDAQMQFTESLVQLQKIGDQFAVANTYNNLGHVFTELGDLQKALEHFRDALRLAQQIGAVPLMLEALTGMARLKHQQGDNAEAIKMIRIVMQHPGINGEVEAMVKPLEAAVLAELSPEHTSDAIEPLESFIQKLTASV